MSSPPVLRPIDYSSNRPVILSVDSCPIATGIILSQIDDQGRKLPARYGSLPMNEREACYSQPKLELFGLYRALRHFRLYIVGVQNLIVEVDAKYIKEMLNRPDLQPNAVINRWIGGILTYTFKLIHVPAKNFKGTDGLSWRRKADDDTKPEESDKDSDDDLDDFNKDIKAWYSESSDLIQCSGQDFSHLETFNHSTGCEEQVLQS